MTTTDPTTDPAVLAVATALAAVWEIPGSLPDDWHAEARAALAAAAPLLLTEVADALMQAADDVQVSAPLGDLVATAEAAARRAVVDALLGAAHRATAAVLTRHHVQGATGA
ncbi:MULTISPECIES: hypothetical protein [Actinosynnema]|uniref:Uncharacterized protein n=1 Tax=Actinosynnema pretiosum TaxID=42197 RepID=A0A290ZAV3_9PSEU|nr:hypothetical protein [Actinosynnema pretiosum]ATE56160.1 hypothetical protein CNX65_25160 [Actinosynnema pretiosum]MCP2098610.1 hypothetical protein [Actinosynnema pretiosum]